MYIFVIIIFMIVVRTLARLCVRVYGFFLVYIWIIYFLWFLDESLFDVCRIDITLMCSFLYEAFYRLLFLKIIFFHKTFLLFVYNFYGANSMEIVYISCTIDTLRCFYRHIFIFEPPLFTVSIFTYYLYDVRTKLRGWKRERERELEY